MTQGELAHLCDVTDSAVSQWETGKSKPSSKHLEDLAWALDLSMEGFFGKVPKRRKP